MRIHITFVLCICLSNAVFGQIKDSSIGAHRFGIHVEFGMQGDVYKQIGVNGVFDETRWDYMARRKDIAFFYLDIGGAYSFKQWEVGAAVRLAIARQTIPESFRDEYSIVPMPAVWAARYFGKYDHRGFRVGFNVTPVIIRYYFRDGFVPDPNDRIVPVGSSTTYWAFGPTMGTRIFRKGWFKDTYINLNPQVAPPAPDDRLWLTEVGWYWRVNAMLTKNFNFRK